MTTSTDVATARPDTSEMVMVHNAFRSHFRALPDLVRGVDTGDIARARRVVAFFEEMSNGLHNHHTTEDELMWPILLDRAPTDHELVLRMEEQHERIAELNAIAATQSKVFATAADPAVRAEFAETLAAIAAALDEHMGEEERHILPLVEQVLSVLEWNAIGETARAHIPKDRQLVFFGFMLQASTPDERRRFLQEVPLLARLMWRLVGKRAYGKEHREVYGIAPDWAT